jgi:hypothetical protein
MVPPNPTSRGSRTAAYVVAGALATFPAILVLGAFVGFTFAMGAVLVMWTSGIVWLLKRRQEDPSWDHRLPGARP